MSRKYLTPIVLPANPTQVLEAAPKQYVDLMQWNAAWGIRAIAPTIGMTTVPASGAGVITSPLVYTTVVGRRYRIHYHCRAISVQSGPVNVGLAFPCWTTERTAR